MNYFFKIIFRPWLKNKELFEQNLELREEIDNLEDYKDSIVKEKDAETKKNIELIQELHLLKDKNRELTQEVDRLQQEYKQTLSLSIEYQSRMDLQAKEISLKDEMLATQKKMMDSLDEKNSKLIDDAVNHKCVEPTAENVIKNVIKRGISYYDYSKLPQAEKVQYYQGAQRLLKDTVLRNEANYYIADIVTEIAKQSKDFGEVRDLRHTIVGVEQLIERLKTIENPLKDEDKLDPQAEI